MEKKRLVFLRMMVLRTLEKLNIQQQELIDTKLLKILQCRQQELHMIITNGL